MKILHVATYLSEDGAYGGPISVALEQMRELARHGHEVHFAVGWDGRARLAIPGVKVHLFRARGLRQLRFSGLTAPGLVSFVLTKGRSFDIVHVHLGRDLITGVSARVLVPLRIPFVTQTHGMVQVDRRLIARVFDRLFTRAVLENARTRLVLTPDEARSLTLVAHVSETTALRNAVRYDSDSSAKAMPATPKVLFLARLHPRKRVMAFAQMGLLLHERGIRADYEIVGPDEGDLAELKVFIDAHRSVSMRYRGPAEASAVKQHFASADIYVLPSVGEVYPMTVIEAIANKIPVVMTRDSGIAGDVLRMGAGVVTGATPHELATGVEEIISQSELREHIESGQERAMKELFDIKSVAGELESIYIRAVSGTNAAARSHRPSLLWLTNTAAPYRLPLWKEIAKNVDLEVLLLENSRRLGRDGSNRGSDWAADGRDAPFRMREVATAVVRRGEARHYFPLQFNVVDIARSDGILIGGWDSPAYLLASLIAKACRTKTIGFYESHAGSHQFEVGIIAWIRRTYFRHLDEIVVPGEAAHQAVLAMGVAPDRIRTGFNAVDGMQIYEATNRLRQIAGPGHDHPVRFLAIAQLIERKNLKSLVLALSKLTDRLATLEIVGVGPQRRDLEKLCDDLGLGQRVRFSGHVPNASLPDVFARADILVHVPTEEVWGLVVNEALAAGLRVVVSQECGVTANVKHMRGVHVTAGDLPSIVTTMLDASAGPLDPIREPEILKHSPTAFADVFLQTLPSSKRA